MCIYFWSKVYIPISWNEISSPNEMKCEHHVFSMVEKWKSKCKFTSLRTAHISFLLVVFLDLTSSNSEGMLNLQFTRDLSTLHINQIIVATRSELLSKGFTICLPWCYVLKIKCVSSLWGKLWGKLSKRVIIL